MRAGLGITIWLIFFSVILWQIVKELIESWRYKHRDPDDETYWSVDQWADFFYKEKHDIPWVPYAERK